MNGPARTLVALSVLVGGCVSQGQYDDCQRDATELRTTLEARARAQAEDQETTAERLARLARTNDALERTLLALAGEFEAADVDRAALRQSVADAQARLDALTNETGALGSDLDRARRSLASAERSLAELRAREAAERRRAETFRQLLTQMRSLIESNSVRVRITRNRMVVELPEGVLFDSGRAEIRSPGQRVLEQVSTVLVSLEDREFQVAGHTDDVPIRTRRFPSNWELSTARALNVAAFLRAHAMPAERLSVAGYADTQPVASNEDDAGRAQNRRIEIVLQPRLDELPDLSSLDTPRPE